MAWGSSLSKEPWLCWERRGWMWSQCRECWTWERDEFHSSCSRALSPTSAGSKSEEGPSLLWFRRSNYFLISPELIFLLGKFSLSLCLDFPFSALTFCSVQLELATQYQQWIQDFRPKFLYETEMKAFWSFSALSQFSNGTNLPVHSYAEVKISISTSISVSLYLS